MNASGSRSARIATYSAVQRSDAREPHQAHATPRVGAGVDARQPPSIASTTAMHRPSPTGRHARRPRVAPASPMSSSGVGKGG